MQDNHHRRTWTLYRIVGEKMFNWLRCALIAGNMQETFHYDDSGGMH